jgi:hypothetical protein
LSGYWICNGLFDFGRIEWTFVNMTRAKIRQIYLQMQIQNNQVFGRSENFTLRKTVLEEQGNFVEIVIIEAQNRAKKCLHVSDKESVWSSKTKI